MEQIIARISEINKVVNGVVWGPVMLVLLVGTGIFLTLRTGFIQVRKFPYILRNTIGTLFSGKKKGRGKSQNLTPFEAVATALASTVGTGNIAGVTGAIFVGGPGAVFWMWISAIFGMFTKYAEIVLAVKFRQTAPDGSHYGGPMYYIEKGLHMKWLAVIFALLGGIACFGIGNIAQSTEISGAVNSLLSLAGFSVSNLAVGIILAVIVGIVIIGGVKRIGQVASYMVPFMACFYILAGIAIIVLRIGDVPRAFAVIIQSAFTSKAVAGGATGYAVMLGIQQGIARGVFSNEAGLGSAPIAHAASETKDPVEQGMWGIFEVFVDTIVICTITSLAVILSGVYDGATIAEVGGTYISKGVAAAAAFNTILPGTLGGIVLQVSLLFFSLTTILGWSYYGERCWGYLSNNSKTVNLIYKIAFVLVCVVGAVGSGNLMWDISDTLNAMMAIPNLVGLLLLSGVVVRITRNYFANPLHR